MNIHRVLEKERIKYKGWKEGREMFSRHATL
jgi:hypothetical protein